MQCLKWKNVELDLITDPGIFVFFEEDARRVFIVFYIFNRYSKDSKKSLKKYDPK